MRIFRRYIVFTLMAFLTAISSNAIETAEQVLSRCANKFNTAPSVSLKFTISNSGSKTECEMSMARDKYHLSSPELQVWYDGTTQWSLDVESKELSITEPTEEEMIESNPFFIINNYKEAFTCRRLSGDKNEIELVAKNKMSSVRKAVITIDSSSWLPSKLIVTMSNGRTFTANIVSAEIGKSLPASNFIYNKKQFPAKNIIDLR